MMGNKDDDAFWVKSTLRFFLSIKVIPKTTTTKLMKHKKTGVKFLYEYIIMS